MRIRDSLVTLAAAVATSALILTLFGSAPLDAALSGEQLPPTPRPTLTVGDVELSVDSADLEDSAAVARIVAVNQSNRPADANATLTLMAQGPRDANARMVSVPLPVWSQPCVVELDAGETRELEIAVDALPKGQEGWFVLSLGDQQIPSQRFAPPGFQRMVFTNQLDIELF